PGSPSPSTSSTAGPLTSPPAPPTRPPPPTTWDGRHNTPWPRHAPTPGVGRSTTPEALPAEPAPHTALSRGTQENPRRTGSRLVETSLCSCGRSSVVSVRSEEHTSELQS